MFSSQLSFWFIPHALNCDVQLIGADWQISSSPCLCPLCGSCGFFSPHHIFMTEFWRSTLKVLFLKQSLFPLRFLDAALCHSQYALRSISIITAPQGQGRKSLCTDLDVCVLVDCCCYCTTVRKKCAWLHVVFVMCVGECIFLYSHCISSCLCIFCMLENVRVCVYLWASHLSVVFSFSLTVTRLSAICPSLKRQLFSGRPLGDKETTGRLRSFFYLCKDGSLLPVLLLFQEVFYCESFPFLPSGDFTHLWASSLFLSPTFCSPSLKWWCWLCVWVNTLLLSFCLSACFSTLVFCFWCLLS